jgi:hypothetical protein
VNDLAPHKAPIACKKNPSAKAEAQPKQKYKLKAKKDKKKKSAHIRKTNSCLAQATSELWRAGLTVALERPRMIERALLLSNWESELT